MKKIEVKKWKAIKPDGTEGEENTLVMLNALVAGKKPEQLPRGIDKFRLFSRISKAFEKAEKTNMLELEDGDYEFLKEAVEKDIPSAWGMNKNINEAVEAFLNAKEE